MIGSGAKAIECVKLIALQGIATEAEGLVCIVSEVKVKAQDLLSHGIYE